MKTHRIIATPWQIESARRGALKTVILTYNKPIIHLGDRLYFAEQWCRSEPYGFFLESTTPEAEMLGWQPAETMPEESARYWFEVTGVSVLQLRQVSFKSFSLSGLHLICPEVNYPSYEQREAWNKSYPDNLWGDDLWVRVLAVERLPEIPLKT
jgi:hypothetical protein